MPIRPPTHRARGLARREALLRAAFTVVTEHGIEGATHRGIAEAAGVPLSTTSYFFSSLDELLAEAITLAFADVIANTNAAILAMHQGSPSTEQLVGQITDFVLQSPTAGIIAQFEAYLAVERRPELRGAIANVVDSYENAIGTALRLFDIDPAPHRVRLLLAMLDGFAIQRIAHPRQDDREILRAALRELLLSFAAND
jgi:DNA-binding transcriptional regulator YbjK